MGFKVLARLGGPWEPRHLPLLRRDWRAEVLSLIVELGFQNVGSANALSRTQLPLHHLPGRGEMQGSVGVDIKMGSVLPLLPDGRRGDDDMVGWARR